MKYFSIPSGLASYTGWGASHQLIDEINEIKPDSILIVADPIVVQLGIIDELLQKIRDTKFAFDLYTDITPEPTLETGEKLVAFARKGRYNMVVGIGGGSCLDLTKLASVFTNNEGDLIDYLNLTAVRKIKNKGVFTILIPTTSGTGSEVTDISVLALAHTKDVINHEYLKANLAIVDPQLTVSVPPQVTAATGADAFTHAIEAYLSVNANPVSDGLALQAIRLIGGSLPQAVKNGNDKEARIAMSYGSYIAGLAFHNAGVGAVHALAYPLGGQFHMAHGDSNAVMLPYVLGFISRSCQSRLKDILSALDESSYDMPDELAARRCISNLALLMKEIGIPDTLKNFNIPESAIQSLTRDAVLQKRLLSRCPVELDEKSIYTIYEAAFKGEITYESS